MSRGPRGSGTGEGPQGADPPPPPGGGRPQNRGFPRISPAQHAPRCPSWISTSGRTPFLPTGPRPTGWRVDPSPGRSLSAAGTPTPFRYLGALPFTSSESGAPLTPIPHREAPPGPHFRYLSAWNNPARPLQSTFRPSPGQVPLSSRAESGLTPTPVQSPAPFPSRNRGRGALCPGSRLSPLLLDLERGPFSPGTRFSLLTPPPQHSGAGGGRARLQLPFVPRGMAETPPGCPIWLIRVGAWVRGSRPLQETLPLFPGGMACEQRSALGEAGPSRGGRANRFLFVTWSWPSDFEGWAVCCIQKPQEGPMKAHSSAQGLRVGPLQSFAVLGIHLRSVLEERMELNHH